MLRRLTSLPRTAKQAILVGNDVFFVPVALVAAFALQSGSLPGGIVRNWEALLILTALAALISLALGIHRIQLKAYENRAVTMTALHAVLMGVTAAMLDKLAGYGTPLSTFINFTLVYFLLVYSSRLVLLQLLLAIYRKGQEQIRVLIYGAGRTGQQLAAALKTDDSIRPVAFVDDNRSTHSTMVSGLHVFSPLTLSTLIRDKQVRRVLLAMPSVSRTRLAEITRRLQDLGVEVHTLPSFAQLAGTGGPLAQQLKPVPVGKFLGRPSLDNELVGGAELYRGKTVMITGAGGSIGSELCRQALSCAPARLVMVENSELALYTIDKELTALAQRMGVALVPVLASVCDGPAMRQVLTQHAPQIVLHAAAYKHVPMVQKNPLSGFANNVLGTHTLATAAGEAGVERFMLISTDKAVRPKNLMGASKRLAEQVVQDLASRSRKSGPGTIYSMVRFGNVIGSSGSVIPLFQDQIARGGPVTLTHKDVTRYFMTIPEAARLVLVSAGFAQGGDVFVLDMGDPVPIWSLARQMIEAAGLRVRDAANPGGDIEIVLTGLRDGEKLHEELLIGNDQQSTPHPKIMKAREAHLSEIEVAACLRAIRTAVAEADEAALMAAVARWVEGGADLAVATSDASVERRQ